MGAGGGARLFRIGICGPHEWDKDLTSVYGRYEIYEAVKYGASIGTTAAEAQAQVGRKMVVTAELSSLLSVAYIRRIAAPLSCPFFIRFNAVFACARGYSSVCVWSGILWARWSNACPSLRVLAVTLQMVRS